LYPGNLQDGMVEYRSEGFERKKKMPKEKEKERETEDGIGKRENESMMERKIQYFSGFTSCGAGSGGDGGGGGIMTAAAAAWVGVRCH
jgi:hypothetical protein